MTAVIPKQDSSVLKECSAFRDLNTRFTQPRHFLPSRVRRNNRCLHQSAIFEKNGTACKSQKIRGHGHADNRFLALIQYTSNVQRLNRPAKDERREQDCSCLFLRSFVLILFVEILRFPLLSANTYGPQPQSLGYNYLKNIHHTPHVHS
jgi:hypothetical protein